MVSSVRHNLAIELSEHFQFAPDGGGVPRRHWDRFPSRLAHNAELALRLFDRHDLTATFFVDDWIARHHPDVVRKVADAGHEIALQADARTDFIKDVGRLEAVSGYVVHGWRPAPGKDLAPVVESDLFYGLGASCAGTKCAILDGGILSTGEWLRILPEAMVAGFISSWAHAESERVFSFQVWELDAEVPHLATLSSRGRLRAYRNLPQFAERLDRLMAEVSFMALRDQLGLPRERSTHVQDTHIATLPAAPVRKERQPLSIVVPCYNEEPGLGYLAKALAALDAGFGRRHRLSFVLVDDGSTDRTWAEMERLFGDDPRFQLERHPHNRGIGAAILTGIMAARDDVVAVMDSDCSYDPARLEEMLPLLEPDVALVTASPYHALGGVEGVPEWRLFLSRGASWLYRSVLRNKLATYTSCFRVCRKAAVTDLALRHEGYIGVVEMLARLDLEGWRIVEHPVVLEARLLGRSKLRIVRVIADHLRFISEISITRLASRARPDLAKVTR